MLSFFLCRPCVAQEFEVEGALTVTTERHEKVAQKTTRTFVVDVKNSHFKMDSVSGGSNFRLTYVLDSEKLYQLSLGQVPQNAASYQFPSFIRPASMPVADDGSCNNELWLAFASQGFFKSFTNEPVLALWSSGPKFPFVPYLNLQFSTNQDKLGLPKTVTYIDRTYPQSYTNATYRVLTTTNINGALIPTEFEFIRYAYDSPGRLLPFETFHGLVSRVATNVADASVQPAFLGISDVYDYRTLAREFLTGVQLSTAEKL